MSQLSRFMSLTRAILDDPDRRAPNPHQPPVFVRTNWLFTEIDEAIAKAAELSEQIKVARLNTNVVAASQLNDELRHTLWQATELCKTADEQFKREVV